jgi:hypothetical protein
MYKIFYFFLIISSISSLISCTCGKCAPSGELKTIKVPIELTNSGGPCLIAPSVLISDYKKPPFGKSLSSELKGKSDKWVIEIKAVGSCSNCEGWDELYKINDSFAAIGTFWTPSIETIQGKEYFVINVPNIPVNNGEVSFLVFLYSTCTSCTNPTRNVRNYYEGGVKFVPTANGGTTEVITLKTGSNTNCI